jgi:hypothetical protein
MGVTLNTATGAIAGTLMLPSGNAPYRVVLIVAGSGPTDRNGNNPALPGENDAYKLLAQALSLEGIASVRYDNALATKDLTSLARCRSFERLKNTKLLSYRIRRRLGLRTISGDAGDLPLVVVIMELFSACPAESLLLRSSWSQIMLTDGEVAWPVSC